MLENIDVKEAEIYRLHEKIASLDTMVKALGKNTNELKDELVKKSKEKGINKKENANEPIDPDIVFFGLILVNFLPLNNFPNTNPPISEAIDTRIV